MKINIKIYSFLIFFIFWIFLTPIRYPIHIIGTDIYHRNWYKLFLEATDKPFVTDILYISEFSSTFESDALNTLIDMIALVDVEDGEGKSWLKE